ncbi:hypothetical protein LG293_15895 (plasmid) [Citricoccus nitrophenolicus]
MATIINFTEYRSKIMAQQTEKNEHAASLIADTLEQLDGLDLQAQAEAVLTALAEHYDVRRKVAQPAETPEPAVGQTWRNKKSDRLVRITGIRGRYNLDYEALTGRGPKVGTGWKGYWNDRFEFVAEADTEARA